MNDYQMRADTTISAQYSQVGAVANAIDERKLQAESKKLGKMIADNINQSIKSTVDIEGVIKDLEKNFKVSLNEMSNEVDKNGKKIFLTKDLKEAQSLLDSLGDKYDSLLKVEKTLTQESHKKHKNEALIVTAEKERIEIANEVNKIENLYQLKLEEIRLTKEKEQTLDQMAVLNAEKRKTSSEKELKALDAKISKLNTISVSQEKIIENNKRNQQDISDNFDNSIKDTTGTLEKTATNLNKEAKTFGDKVSEIKDYVNTVSSALSDFRSVAGSFQNEFGARKETTTIDRYDTELDQYIQNQMKLSGSFGMYGDNEGFNTLKNDIMNGMTEGLGNIYNQSQIMDSLSTISEMGFTDHATAVAMSKDIAYAKEYMGMSSESLKSMYEFQVRSGDDTFMKRTLNSIVALQKSGVDISKEQLASMVDNSMTLSEAMMNMGMSGDAVSSLTEQLTALQVSGNEINSGFGDTLYNMMNDIITGGIDKIAEYGITNPDYAWNAMKQGDIQPMLDAIMNSQATKAYSTLAQGNYGVGDTVIASDITGDRSGLYSQLTAENINKLNSAFAKNKDLLAKNPNAFDEEQEATANKISIDYEKANELVQNALGSDWLKLSEGLGSKNYWDGQFDSINSKLSIITGVISLGTTLVTLFKGFPNFLGNIFGIGKSAASGGSSLISTAASKIGSGLMNLGGGTVGGATVAGLGITAGVVATGKSIWDGVATGTQGFKDENGNRIEGTGGLGSGITAAVSNQDLYASKGSDVGSGALKGAGVGAMIGTFVGGPIGTAIGGAIGAGVGALGGLIAHGSKERKKAELTAQKEREKQTALAKATSENIQAIKDARDVALADRYNDDRWGYGSIHNTAAPSYNYSYGSNNWSTTSNYGSRIFDGYEEDHNGIDLGGVAYGTAIGSAGNGIVTKVVDGYTWKDSNLKGGDAKSNYVDVYDPINDVTYRYYHLAGAAVTEGQAIEAGMPIGYVGNTGDVRPIPDENNPTAGTHLHFSVMKNGSYINPEPYINSSIFNTPVRSSKLPSVNVNKGKGSITDGITNINDTNILNSLNMINNTLVAMDKRQTDQQNLLNALTNTPIHNLGV